MDGQNDRISAYTLTKTRFHAGVWEGFLLGDDTGATPQLAVTLRDQALSGVSVTQDEVPGRWLLQVPVPVEAVGDGVHTFLIADLETDGLLGSFSLISGEVLTDDLRAEVDLLRAELDMLKRAFRRHCLETS